MQSREEKFLLGFQAVMSRAYFLTFLVRNSCRLAEGNGRRETTWWGHRAACLKCWSLWDARARLGRNPPGRAVTIVGIAKSVILTIRTVTIIQSFHCQPGTISTLVMSIHLFSHFLKKCFYYLFPKLTLESCSELL